MLRALLVIVFVFPPLVAAQEWTRFRGPNGMGVSETALPTEWSDDAALWKVDLPGVGHSSPVLWGERLFLTSGDEAAGDRVLLCFDAKTGRRLWIETYEVEKHGKHSLNSFASPTPTVDAQRVYHCLATPEQLLVIALTHEGDELWRRDLGPFRAGHGYGASPIVVEGLVIVPSEQQGDSSLVALDAATGEVQWRIPRDSKVHFYTPCIRRIDGRTELIFTNWEQGIAGVDLHSGRTLWSADVFDKSHIESSIGSPILAGELVLGVCGWLGHGNEVIAVRPPKGEGQPAEQVYRIDRGAPLCTTPLVKDDLLFLWSDNGIVVCADAATGEVHWRKRIGGVFYSSPIAAGDHVYNISADGDVVTLAAGRDFEVVARSRLEEGTHATPAIADGVLYVRTFSHLLAFRGDE
ncbi:MAG: PQQ-binding-like beta-propeller repeat protein [Planctomycetes bacterium]|nr:PQQ-binding-like beta-propeller repeat protein [Planctomycetota bacterium]